MNSNNEITMASKVFVNGLVTMTNIGHDDANIMTSIGGPQLLFSLLYSSLAFFVVFFTNAHRHPSRNRNDNNVMNNRGIIKTSLPEMSWADEEGWQFILPPLFEDDVSITVRSVV
jgi:hypothetical protein